MVDIPGLNMTTSEYYPYVYYKICIDMCEQQKVWTSMLESPKFTSAQIIWSVDHRDDDSILI